MELEHIVRSFPVDDNLQKEVQALEADGWQVIPGIPPVMVYHLARAKQAVVVQPESSALGRLQIDDSLIMVIGPDGKPKS
jgi:hypothetical protein